MAITMHHRELRGPAANHAPEAPATRGCDGAAAGAYSPAPPRCAGRHPLNAIAWEKTYPGSADQLRRMRADLKAALRGFGAAEDAILLLSELGANAVRHTASGTDGGTFTVRVKGFAGRWLLGEVEDMGSSWHGDLGRSARDASGLNIMTTVSMAHGVVPCGAATRRIVWFLLPGPADAPGAAR